MPTYPESTIERHFSNEFVTVPKSIFEMSLSVKAMGIYFYLVSKPDFYEFNSPKISKNFKESKRSMESGFKELEKAGLLQREIMSTEAGKILPNIWNIFYPE